MMAIQHLSMLLTLLVENLCIVSRLSKSLTTMGISLFQLVVVLVYQTVFSLAHSKFSIPPVWAQTTTFKTLTQENLSMSTTLETLQQKLMIWSTTTAQTYNLTGICQTLDCWEAQSTNKTWMCKQILRWRTQCWLNCTHLSLVWAPFSKASSTGTTTRKYRRTSSNLTLGCPSI